MAGPPEFGRRLAVDPRLVAEVSRDEKMASEQGSGFMQEWGGPGAYKEMAGWHPEERMVYFAVQNGATTPEEIMSMTDLEEPRVNSALDSLTRKGVVSKGEASTE